MQDPFRVIKIGRSDNLPSRMKDYPKSSQMIGCYNVIDAIVAERALINAFDEQFAGRRDIGREYYSGQSEDMIFRFFNVLFNKKCINFDKINASLPPQESKSIELHDNIQQALKLQRQLNGLTCKEVAEFSPSLFISNSDYKSIQSKQKSNEDITSMEKQQYWTYECIHNIWKVPQHKVDLAFYDQFICPGSECVQKNITQVFDLYFQHERYKDMINNDILQNVEIMIKKLDIILCSKENNIELFKKKTQKHYKCLIEGQRLLEGLMKGVVNYKDKFKTCEQIILQKDEYNIAIKEYIVGLNESDYTDIVNIFLEKEYNHRDAVLQSERRMTWFGKTILEKAFGIHVVNNAKTNNTNMKDYGSKLVNCDWNQLFEVYDIIGVSR